MSIIVGENAVDTTLIRLGRPFFDRENALCFSAYAFGWGYCAFSLEAAVAHEVLGSIDESPRQILLAFAIGQARIRKAVHRAARKHGERIRLTPGDFP
ncbi:hypothetical protein P0D88_07730 [Paraburkholderia sp. RL18-103-BIB-C]|uniref:hypothetical protein n=1 Tax=Paraburkholderia sp. RL18-103-BIB-C TaxID=3031637 RepID=UPI0038BB2692